MAGIVAGDKPAHRNPTQRVHPAQRRFQMVAADVVEVDVDALGRGLLQRLANGRDLVVDHGVQADLVAQPARLVLGAGRAHHVTALDLRDLGSDRTYRTGSGRDEHLLAFLELADVQQAAVGREPRHAQGMHVDGQRQIRIGIELGQAFAIAGEVFAEAHAVGDQIAHGKRVRLRLHHPAQRAAHHGLVQFLTGGQSRAHGGIDRHVEVLDQHLAVRSIGAVTLDERKITLGRHA